LFARGVICVVEEACEFIILNKVLVSLTVV
jgi:hypothetical protein